MFFFAFLIVYFYYSVDVVCLYISVLFTYVMLVW